MVEVSFLLFISPANANEKRSLLAENGFINELTDKGKLTTVKAVETQQTHGCVLPLMLNDVGSVWPGLYGLMKTYWKHSHTDTTLI